MTAPHVTLGNGVPLQRMRAFQDEGHVGVLIVGDYTTRIGDPSGRSATRPILDPEEIDRNAQRYFEHASTIIDPEKTELRFNSEWLSKVDFAETAPADADDDRGAHPRARRLREALRPSARRSRVSELLYPLMQAYDSVAVKADVELGGTDQLFNLLAGRDVMEAYGLEPQVALTVDLLESWDGTAMSASRGNYIALFEDRRTSSSARRCAIPDELLAAVVPRSSWSGGRRRPRSARGEARARPVHRPARARGGGGRPGRGALHARRPPARGAGGRPGGDRCPPAIPIHLPGAARRAPRRRLDERGAAADRAGRRQARRRGGHRARRPAGASRRSALCRPENAVSCASAPA